MHSANRRRTRSSGSALDQTNLEAGGEVTPSVDKVPEQSNASVPLQTPEAVEHLEEPRTNDGNGNRMMEQDEGVSNGVSGEEHKSTPVTGKKSSGSHRELVLGLPCRGQFEFHRSSTKLGGGGERNVVVSSHKRAKRSKTLTSSSTSSCVFPFPEDQIG